MLQSQGSDRPPAAISGGPAYGEDGFIRELQACVNSARKAGTRVKKLLAGKCQRAAQWECCERGVCAEFSQEKALHQHDIEQIDDDRCKAMKAQDEARERVRQVAQGSRSNRLAAAMREEEDDVDPWAALTSQGAWHSTRGCQRNAHCEDEHAHVRGAQKNQTGHATVTTQPGNPRCKDSGPAHFSLSYDDKGPTDPGGMGSGMD